MMSIVILSLLVAAASPQVIRFEKEYYPPTSYHSNNRLPDVVKASNSLGFKLLRHVPLAGNLFISPLSISMAMGMVYLGSRNKTAVELERVLGYQALNLGSEHVHKGYKTLLEILLSGRSRGDSKEDYVYEIASAILVDKSYEILPSFKEKARHFYDAAAESVSFATHPESVVESINGWVAWKTKNKILNFLQEPLDLLTKLFLLNAVYFKGTWKTKFDQRLTMPDTFYNEGRIPKTVPMMRQKKKFNYGFITSVQSHALELPYDGDHIVMLILLPEKRDGLQNLESQLTMELVELIPSTLRKINVQVTLPRFTLQEEYDMIALFKEMGLQSIFDADLADLRGISPNRGLYVTRILHKSTVDVNEEGSEAATVTGVSAGVRTGGPLHPLFTADHPFVFFIRDIRTNAVLFMGRVNVL